MWQMWCTLLIKWCTLLIKHLVCWAIVPLFTANKTQGKRCKHEFNAHAGGIVRQRKCAVCVCVCARARARATEQRRVPTSKGAAAHHHSCGQIFPPRKSKQHCVMQQAQRRAFLTLLRVRTPHAFLTLGRFQGFTMLLDAGRQSEVPRCLGVSQAPYRISPTQLVAQQRSAIREGTRYGSFVF